MVLVDTSVWIAVFRRNKPIDLEQYVDFDEVVTCLPVIQEVLQGFRRQTDFLIARESMMALPTVEAPLHREVFLQAAELYRTARRQGITVRSSVDCLIAACELRNSLKVLHMDRDFRLLAKIAPLDQEQIKGSQHS